MPDEYDMGNYMSDADKLRGALCLIKRTWPAAKSVELQTSDQAEYGFVLMAVRMQNGSLVAEGNAFEDVTDEICPFLCDLEWSERGGVVGEDDGGAATIEIGDVSDPGYELFGHSVAVLESAHGVTLTGTQARDLETCMDEALNAELSKISRANRAGS